MSEILFARLDEIEPIASDFFTAQLAIEHVWTAPQTMIIIDLGKQFDARNYASLQEAVDAAKTAGGGEVLVADVYNVGSGAVGLNLDDSFRIRLRGVTTGGNNRSGITYHGTGTAVSARSTSRLEIDHMLILAQHASGAAKLLDLGWSDIGGDSAYLHIHHNHLQNEGSNAAAVGIDIDRTEGAIIEYNSIAVLGGVGVRGVAQAGHYVVQADIRSNIFNAGNEYAIEAPGDTWNIVTNIVQDQKFVKAGPAGTADNVKYDGNWVGDTFSLTTPGTALVEDNSHSTVSINNVYAGNANTIAIKKTASSGSLVSIGDYLEGGTGIDITTGNRLKLSGYNVTHAPTILVAGTPETASPVDLTYGLKYVVGKTGHFASGTPTAIPTGVLSLLNLATSAANPPTLAGAAVTNAPLQLTNSGGSTSMTIDAYGAAVGANYIGRNAAGTQAAPTATQSGQSLVSLFGLGYHGSGAYAATNWTTFGSILQAISLENFTGSAQGSAWEFWTVPIGSTSIGRRMRVAQGLMMGGTVDPGIGHIKAFGAFHQNTPVTITAASATMGATDSSVIFNTSATHTYTLVAAATANIGRLLFVKNIAAQTINSASSNVIPLAGGAAGTAILANVAGRWAILQSNGTAWEIIAAN